MIHFNLFIVRHGQTYYNILRKMQGWSNSPLTKNGLREAKAIGKNLSNVKFSAAYCSDTTRAHQTLKIILKNNHKSHSKPIISKYYRDGFYGSFEGENIERTWYVSGAPHGLPSFKAIVGKYSIGKARDFVKEADPFHLAENNQEFWQRWHKGLQLMRNNPSIKDGNNVLLIGHGMSLLSFVERFSHGQYNLIKRPANGSLTRAIVTNNDVKVTEYNKTL